MYITWEPLKLSCKYGSYFKCDSPMRGPHHTSTFRGVLYFLWMPPSLVQVLSNHMCVPLANPDLYLKLCVYMYLVLTYTYNEWHVLGSSENNLWESALSFHHAGLTDWIQAIIWWWEPLLDEPSCQPKILYFCMSQWWTSEFLLSFRVISVLSGGDAAKVSESLWACKD